MLEKFKMHAGAAALMAFTGALPAAADNITISEPDGTSWESFTTTPDCIAQAVQSVLIDPRYFHRDRMIAGNSLNTGGAMHIDDAKNSLVISVYFEPTETEEVVVQHIEVQQVNYEDLSEKSLFTTLLSYHPISLMGSRLIDPEVGKEYAAGLSYAFKMQNGEMGTTGQGTLKYDLEATAVQLDERIRSCGFALS